MIYTIQKLKFIQYDKIHYIYDVIFDNISTKDG